MAAMMASPELKSQLVRNLSGTKVSDTGPTWHSCLLFHQVFHLSVCLHICLHLH